MSQSNAKTIGIVGGMGPHAGLQLLKCIMDQTKAAKDQDHLSVLLASYPVDIPDRSSYLANRLGINPAYSISRIITQLSCCGAEVIGMACNTAHAPPILGIIQQELSSAALPIQLVNMPIESCAQLNKYCSTIRRVGVLATNGTYQARIYDNSLEDLGFEVVRPEPAFQNDTIHRIIYDPEFGIKAMPQQTDKRVSLLLDKALRFFHRRRADAIILGCTEFSLLAKSMAHFNGIVIDSTTELARALIREATACCPSSLEDRQVLKAEPGKDKHLESLSIVTSF